VWSRCDAEASPERGYYYHPSRHSAGQPIVAGWAYQFIVQLGFARESWVAPVDVLRVRPTENPNEVAAEQIERLLQRAPAGRCGASPLFVFDAGYDPVQLQTGMEGWNAQILVRLRAGRCFYADPTGPPARTAEDRAATGQRWTPAILRRGPSPQRSTAVRIQATAWYMCAPGPAYTPRRTTTPRAGPAARAP
jgi:hypothetical protein